MLKLGRTRLVAGWALAASAALAACGRSTVGVGSSSSSATSGAQLPSSTESVFSFGADYVASNQMVPAQGGGVWVWGESSSGPMAYLVQGGTTPKSYSLGSQSSNITLGAVSGLTTTPDGSVWFGVQQTILRLDPATGAVQQWQIPTLPLAPAAAATIPAPLPKVEAVEKIAGTPSGQVIIAMSLASALSVFDPSTGAFSSLALGTQGDAVGVAVAPNGQIAATINNYGSPTEGTIVEFIPGGQSHLITTPQKALAVSAGSDSFFVGSGGGIDSLASAITASVIDPVATNGLVLNPTIAAQSLPDGRLVDLTGDAIAIVNPVTGASKLYSFPKSNCSPPGAGVPPPPPGTTPPSPSPQLCALAPQGVAVSPSGDIYFITGDEPATIGMIPAGSF